MGSATFTFCRLAYERTLGLIRNPALGLHKPKPNQSFQTGNHIQDTTSHPIPGHIGSPSVYLSLDCTHRLTEITASDAGPTVQRPLGSSERLENTRLLLQRVSDPVSWQLIFGQAVSSFLNLSATCSLVLVSPQSHSPPMLSGTTSSVQRAEAHIIERIHTHAGFRG